MPVVVVAFCLRALRGLITMKGTSATLRAGAVVEFRREEVPHAPAIDRPVSFPGLPALLWCFGVRR